jgi:quinol-cytochrome oxidoreductase complex cytochrome b subunit
MRFSGEKVDGSGPIEREKVVLSALYSHAVRYPSPRRLPLGWAVGSAIIALFGLQITTGVLLSLFYDSNAENAFSSIVYIIQDINYGYMLKYLHLNIASAIFFLVYLHMFRSMYFMTYLNLPTVWYSGILLLLMTIVTAFLGYVLP